MTRVLIGNTTWSSPYVLSCFVALREKGLDFDLQDVALDRREHHSAEFALKTLTSRVPVLLEDGFALSESSAIIEYLEEAYPAPHYPALLPQERRARAQARQLMAWLRSDLLPLREERSAEYVFFAHDRLEAFKPLSERGHTAASKLLNVATQVLPAGGGPLFGAWCIADTDLAMMLQRLVKTGYVVPDAIARYARDQFQRPAVLEYCKHPRPEYRRAVPMM